MAKTHNFTKKITRPEITILSNEGDSIEGYYVECKPAQGKNKSNLYVMRDDDSNLRAFWGSTQLDELMKYVTPGTSYIRVTYKGIEHGKNGGNDFKSFDVEVADE